MIAYIIFISYTVAAFLLFIFIPHPQMRQVIMYVSLAYYLIWGLIYHATHKNLTLAVMLEYCAIALLAVIGLQIAFSPQL